MAMLKMVSFKMQRCVLLQKNLILEMFLFFDDEIGTVPINTCTKSSGGNNIVSENSGKVSESKLTNYFF